MATTGKSPAQMFALAFGAVYLLVGIVGFAVTGFDNFASDVDPGTLIIFDLNPLHNIVHIAIGAAWLGAASTHAAAKSANLGIGVVYLLVGVLGLGGILVGELIANNPADTGLHLVTGLLAVYFGTAGAEMGRTATV